MKNVKGSYMKLEIQLPDIWLGSEMKFNI